MQATWTQAGEENVSIHQAEEGLEFPTVPVYAFGSSSPNKFIEVEEVGGQTTFLPLEELENKFAGTSI